MSASKKKVKKVAAKKKPGTALAHNSKRAAANKALNQKQLRDKLSASGHIHRIDLCLKRLETISAYTAKKRVLDRGEQAKLITETGIIKTRLDAHFKILNKFLPDLRSIDFKDEEGNNSVAEAATAWAKALNK